MWFHIFQFSVLPSTVSFIEVVQCQSLAPKPVIFRCLYQAWENILLHCGVVSSLSHSLLPIKKCSSCSNIVK